DLVTRFQTEPACDTSGLVPALLISTSCAVAKSGYVFPRTSTPSSLRIVVVLPYALAPPVAPKPMRPMLGADVVRIDETMRDMSPYMRELGRLLTCAGDNDVPVAVVVTSTIGLAPVTVMVSCTLPIFNETSTLAAKPCDR